MHRNTYLDVFGLSRDHHNTSQRLLLYHVADNVDGGGQRPLRSDELPSATVQRGSNTIGIDVVRRRVILRDDARFVERENVLETIPRSILGHFAMPFDVHRRVHFRLSIQWFEFRTASRPLAVLRSDGLRSVLVAMMNVACMKVLGYAWLHETKGHAVRGHENVVLLVVVNEFVQRFARVGLRDRETSSHWRISL